jgi:hypothetical protein
MQTMHTDVEGCALTPFSTRRAHVVIVMSVARVEGDGGAMPYITLCTRVVRDTSVDHVRVPV